VALDEVTAQVFVYVGRAVQNPTRDNHGSASPRLEALYDLSQKKQFRLLGVSKVEEARIYSFIIKRTGKRRICQNQCILLLLYSIPSFSSCQ
jgi:hypothetical protein